MSKFLADLPVRVFDAEDDLQIVDRRLPHWSQAGTISFIAWRTDDSMPTVVLKQWHSERAEWLNRHGVDPHNPNWREQLEKLPPEQAREFFVTFWNRWHDELDAAHGKCVLRQAVLAGLVAKSLRHFDGGRYSLFDYVVMPNHVHLLVAFPDEKSMLAQCESWKHFTATQINRHLQQKGRFWQEDAFDHLLRSERQFEYLRRYIQNNPNKAGLREGEYVHYSKPISISARGACGQQC
jgi:putative transposase